MFLSELAADMLLRLSEETADSCAERMAGEYERNGVYERFRWTYMLMSSLMMDYIESAKLNKGNKLHEALVTGWGRLVRVFSGESFTYIELCEYCDRGRIPIQLKHLLSTVPDDYHGDQIGELPKARLDMMITIMIFVRDHLLAAACGDDPCDCLMQAGMKLSVLGKALPPGTRLQGDTFIFPWENSRQQRVRGDKKKLFDLD